MGYRSLPLSAPQYWNFRFTSSHLDFYMDPRLSELRDYVASTLPTEPPPQPLLAFHLWSKEVWDILAVSDIRELSRQYSRCKVKLGFLG